MANISANCQIQTLDRNLGMPAEGPRMIPLPLDFTANDSYDLDISNMQTRGGAASLAMVQAVFIDNFDSGVAIQILVNTGQQRLIVAGGSQAYLPILVPNPARFTFTSPGGAATVKVFLLNFPVPPEIWSGAASVALTGTFDQVSTDLQVDLVGSQVNAALVGAPSGIYHFRNIGANSVDYHLFQWTRPDQGDIEETSGGPVTVVAGGFRKENINNPYPFSKIQIVSTGAGAPGELTGGFYFS
jgi:hypothetical protein